MVGSISALSSQVWDTTATLGLLQTGVLARIDLGGEFGGEFGCEENTTNSWSLIFKMGSSMGWARVEEIWSMSHTGVTV